MTKGYGLNITGPYHNKKKLETRPLIIGGTRTPYVVGTKKEINFVRGYINKMLIKKYGKKKILSAERRKRLKYKIKGY